MIDRAGELGLAKDIISKTFIGNHSMTMTQESVGWIKVAVEATNEFARQALCFEEHVSSSNMGLMEEETPLSGSYLMLTCGEFQMEIGFLSSEKILMEIARILFVVTPEEVLPREDMIDAIKEVINIISGGVKCRLNDQISGGITLSIPFFLEGKDVQEKNQDALIENIIVAGMPVSLYVRQQLVRN